MPALFYMAGEGRAHTRTGQAGRPRKPALREVDERLLRTWAYSLHIGFFAGLIWGVAGCVLAFFGFTEVNTFAWAKPWLNKDLLAPWARPLAGLAVYVLFSMLAALLYALVLRKARGPWPGILFGLAWYGLFFFAIGPALGMLPPYHRLNVHTHVSEMCRFLLWGVFIGYSIALEFTDERAREPGVG